ncbi:MAG: hypothetical protein NC548_37875 [Lachnospiraceae bacterium]|nr:hypothetical protein [Lachnospiraceae bacterium]MCM1231182.1 hypothetical protein [Ruminococcus flavefaciens]
MSINMHVDVKYIKVCALCAYWNDVFHKHSEISNVPDHYYYDGRARELCLCKRHETYGGQPGCPNYKFRFK